MKKEKKALVIEFLRNAKYYYFTVLPFLVRHVVFEDGKEESHINFGDLFYLKTEGQETERDKGMRKEVNGRERKKLGEKSLEVGAF